MDCDLNYYERSEVTTLLIYSFSTLLGRRSIGVSGNFKDGKEGESFGEEEK